MKRSTILTPLLLMAIGAIVAIFGLQSHSTASRDAELTLASVQFHINELQDVPWKATPGQGNSREQVRRELETARAHIERELSQLRRSDVAETPLAQATREFRLTLAPLTQIIRLASRNDVTGGSQAAAAAWTHSQAAIEELAVAGGAYRARAHQALARALYGSAAAIALLFAAFAFFLQRATKARVIAEQLAREVHDLLEISSAQATTDALTGLANRRALSTDLADAVEHATCDDVVVLALFDLDGFKDYNDTFGHPAGDALLARLGERLATTMQGMATTYRIGGDEFCILARAGTTGDESLVRLAAAALSDEGEGFRIGCSYGIAHMPTEAGTPEAALGLADQRMYAQKTSGRASASRQSTDVLVKVLGERSIELQEHIDDVARLAARTARALKLPEQDVHTIRLAAELHDIGKVAIPDAILDKPGKLTEDEWEFMRRHTIIGERIALAAPSLAPAAVLIRASHERLDGNGYPDRLQGEQIPLGARIIAVCDAYDAMVSDRPYQAATSPQDALAELRRCAGTQFDPAVINVFTELIAESLRHPLAEAGVDFPRFVDIRAEAP